MSRFSPFAALVIALSAALAGCSSKSPDEFVASAKAYLARNDLNAGIIELKNALQKQSDLAEARFLLGKALLDRGDPVGAEVELRKAGELKYPADQVVPLLADALFRSGNFEKVLEQDRTVVLTAPEAIAALKTTVSRAHAALGDSAKADTAVSAALQAKPDYGPALVLRARALAGKRDFDAASKIVDDVLSRTPGDAGALTLKGDIAYERQDLDGAAALYRKVIATDPTDMRANEGLLLLLLGKGDLDGARARLDDLKKVLPGLPMVTYFQARLAAQKGDLQAAENLVQELLKSASDNPHALMLGGAIAMQRGQWVVAQQRLASLVSLMPKAPIARQMLARAYVRGGDPAKGLEVLDPLLRAPTPDARTLALAANARLLTGDFESAQQLFNRAAKLEPGSTLNRSGAAVARVMGGDTEGLRQLQGVATDDRKIETDLTLISALISRRDYDAALKAIDRLEQKAPGSAVAPYLRGQVLALRGDLAGARANFEKALAAAPDYFPATDRLAALDWREGKRDAARARFEAFLKSKPGDTRALVGLAHLQEQAGAPKTEVAALFAKAVSAKPTDGWARRQQVQYLLRQQDYRSALNAAQDAATALPNDTEILALLASAQLAAGEFNQAISSYGKLAALQPQSPQPLLGLADAQIGSKSYEAAAETVRKALALAPDSPAVVQRAVSVDMLTGRFDSALARARALQKQTPKAPQGFVIEGDLQYSRHEWAAAAAAYRAALQREPGSPGVAQRLYLSLRASGNQPQADAFAAEWARTQPKDPRFPFFLAGLAIADRRYAEAEEQLNRSLRLDPENANTLNNLAWVLWAQKKPEALDVAEKANQLAPNRPLNMDTLALVLADRGQLPRALEVQKKAVEIDPASPGLRLTLARLYIKSGSKSDARKELTELAKLGDKFPQQNEVRDLLGQL